MNITINLQDANVGPADEFRSIINANSEAIENAFGQIGESVTSVVYSASQPAGQGEGDFWVQPIE